MSGFIGALVVAVGAVVLVAGLGVYSAFACGFVLEKLWQWNFVTLGLPIVPWQTFAAVSLAVHILRPNLKTEEKKSDWTNEKTGTLFIAIVWPWLALFVAWVIR